MEQIFFFDGNNEISYCNGTYIGFIDDDGDFRLCGDICDTENVEEKAKAEAMEQLTDFYNCHEFNLTTNYCKWLHIKLDSFDDVKKAYEDSADSEYDEDGERIDTKFKSDGEFIRALEVDYNINDIEGSSIHSTIKGRLCTGGDHNFIIVDFQDRCPEKY